MKPSFIICSFLVPLLIVVILVKQVSAEPTLTIEHDSQEELKIQWAGGIIQQTSDLKKWIDINPQPSTIFTIDGSDDKNFYRVLSQDSVPIIAFTGQSNTLHIRRNYEPYSTTPLDFHFALTVGNIDASAGTPQYYSSLQTAIMAGQSVGSAWEFASLLKDSEYRKGSITRFAIAQSGKGGQPSRKWKSGSTRHIEFEANIDGLIEQLQTIPHTTGHLAAVVVNQGERDTDTGGDTWAENWTSFITTVRNKYGNQVQIYVQTLNGIHLMPRQQNPHPGWETVRSQQLALATGSGSILELPDVFVFDSNALGGPENTAVYVRDNNVHYSDAGIEQLANGTFNLFKVANAF